MTATLSKDSAEKQFLQAETTLTTTHSLYDLRRAFYGGNVSTTDAIRAYLQAQTGLTTIQSLGDLWRQYFIGMGITNQVSLGDMARDYFSVSFFLKGVGRPNESIPVTADLTTLNVGWFYDWGSTAVDKDDLPVGVEYVPMIYGDWAVTLEQTPAQAIAFTGANVLLGFNEPDYDQQSNVTVARALELWPLFEATGVRLGSPAVSAGVTGPEWLEDFMAEDPRVDFICAHWYPTYSPTALGTFLDGLWNTYHLPIWLTEVGNLDDGASANATLISEVMEILRNRPYVERIAWFAVRGTVEWPTAGLLTSGTSVAFPASGFWPSIWSEFNNSSGSSSISVSNWGVQTTGAVGGYADNTIEILDDLLSADGTYLIDCKVTTLNECYPFVQFRSSADSNDCYELQVRPNTDQVLFRRRTGGSFATLETLSTPLDLNDILHIEIILSGNTIEIRLWKNAASKPGTATATLSSATFATQKRLLLGLNGGNAAASTSVEWQVIDFGLDPGGDLNAAGTVYAALPVNIDHAIGATL